MSDCEKILEHLRTHGSITSWEAITFFKCTRLSGRIYDLRHRGHNIRSEIEEHVDDSGERVRYARYRLEEST